MKRKSQLFFLLTFSAAASVFASNSTGVGSSGGAFLGSNTGVRASGMGNAFVGVANDVNALYYNPAGLGTLRHIEFTALQQNLQEDTAHRNLGFVIPLGEVTSSNVSQFGAIGATIGLLDYGKIQGRDNTGAVTGDFKARDFLWSVGYGKGWYNTFFIGALYKRFDQRIADKRASNALYDLGALYRVSSEWTIGASFKNLGSDLHFSNEEEPLPRTSTVGLGYSPFKDVLTFALDLEKPKESSSYAKAGVEWWANRTIALRTGYDSGIGPDGGFSFGVGIRFIDFEAGWFPVQRLTLDYAFMPGTSVSGVSGDAVNSRQNLSLTMRFGDR